MNILCIVTNNELRLKTLIKNLPTNRNYEIVFVTDPRICSMISTINELYPYANIITSLNILDGFYTEYSCKTKNFEKYALGYKMLVPYYLRLKLNFDKLLMVDDDIIVTEKLNDLFDEIEHPSAKITGIMNKNSRDNKISYEIKNLAYNIFEIEYNEVIPCINGGHVLFNREINYDDYINDVISFIDSDAVSIALSNQRTWLDFYLDEIFFSCFYYCCNVKYGDAYLLKNNVQCSPFTFSNGNIKSIFKEIDNYAITHFAGMNDNYVYKKLKEYRRGIG